MRQCPNCRKSKFLVYKPWLGLIWECRKCGYRGPLVIEVMEPRLLRLLKKIPRGKVTTYGILAKKLGTGPRAVAQMLKNNPEPIRIPCHRVVKSDGSLGGYTWKGRQNVKRKKELLKKEGVEIKKGKIDLRRFGYKF
ncbi:MAG: MGMT family protein [Candidatus Aenigmatarchaeota archaeon]